MTTQAALHRVIPFLTEKCEDLSAIHYSIDWRGVPAPAGDHIGYMAVALSALQEQHLERARMLVAQPHERGLRAASIARVMNDGMA